MSRGPGRIERAIEAAFRAEPLHVFTVDDLARIAYPGVNRAQKKHRVAILRAARRVCERIYWFAWRKCDRPGETIYFDPCEVRSYAYAKHLVSSSQHRTPAEFSAGLDDPTTKDGKAILPGGAWDAHVRINRLSRGGQTEAAAQLRQDWNGPIKRALGLSEPSVRSADCAYPHEGATT